MATAEHSREQPRTTSLEDELRDRVAGEVRFDAGTRAAYSVDASNYREVPIGVVLPGSVDDAVEAVAVCHERGVPVLSRGGGTSLAGQCCNTAVVLDWTKYCHGVVSVDLRGRTAVVEPGIVLDQLDARLAPYGLRIGPKPSTHATCTLGGMIGNNSCGSSAQAYGKMADSVRRLEILTYDGLRMWVGRTDDDAYRSIVARGGRKADIYRGLAGIRDSYLGEIRTRYPDIPRRVSGYNLDSLLPENGFDVGRALVGSEGTLVTVLHAEVALVPVEPANALVVLGYPDVTAAADAVPAVAGHRPTELEGIDARLVRLEHSRALAEQALRQLPEGEGWLMAQFSGDTKDEANRRARSMIDEVAPPHATLVDDPQQIALFWRAREAALGATTFPPGGPQAHPGWEDAAVPPDRLGDYLRDFRRLLDDFGYGPVSLYGHFGHGCVHVRIPFDLRSAEGVRTYRRFVESAARLVVSYGGSLSGEHGDGQSRGELRSIMFGPTIVTAFEELKRLLDPDDRMNPGKVVRPARLDENLRQGVGYRPWEPRTHFAFPHDDHRFSQAADRCAGVGKCRSFEGGVMCPSYRATREEEHSTRGRARLLFEMLNGDVVSDGWRSTEVRDALDLCLACKGCRSDCPVNVDMATYKAEFLSHHYAGRLRPLAHYSMGWLPLWARIAAAAPWAVNAVTHAPGLSRVVKAAGGVDRRREIPLFADQRFTDWYADSQAGRRPGGPAERGTVLLWPDTFTDNFHPAVARAAVEVLEAAGFSVEVPAAAACCGLTWISTGQLGTAKRVLGRTLDVLRPQLRDGTPVVVLEPSCAAVFRADLPELLHGDEDAHRLARQTRTLAEVLAERAPDWRPPRMERRAVAQPHCHQHAILGFRADATLLRSCGLEVDVLDAGCCGLAGNFGFERGHYEVSMACAEDILMPAVRHAGSGTLVLADGFSCRTQIAHADSDVVPVHSAEVLAAALRGSPPGVSQRPAAPGRLARIAAAAAVAVPPAVALGWRRRSG